MGGRPSGSGQPDRDGGCHQRQGLCFPRATFGSGGEGFSGLWGGLAVHVVLSLNFISSYSDEKACHYTFFEKLNHCQWTTYQSLVSNGSWPQTRRSGLAGAHSLAQFANRGSITCAQHRSAMPSGERIGDLQSSRESHSRQQDSLEMHLHRLRGGD